MPNQPGRGPYASGKARREQILDAAQRRFAEGGYERASLGEIARDVGITTPGLTHHFASKEILLLAIAERRFERAAAEVREAPDGVDGLGALRLMMHQTRVRAERPELMELFVRVAGLASDPHSDAHRLFAARYERVAEELTAHLMRGVDAGAFRADADCAAIARDFIALSDGLQLQLVLLPGSVDLVAHVRAHLERVAADIVTGDILLAELFDEESITHTDD
ncbi:TetR/AcrR family transcriptional regulator [Microbacterium sp. B2969]|uniref:TetR/AcrR family transcriptional regulator n=1 Tax=Microbacterium alkaliflavum TaxID=3248839 RepID=A0ABW7QCM0_9MICO